MQPTAIYRKIYNNLLEQIKSGSLTINTKLPSEKQLCQSYNCSRITAQKALALLSEQGYVQRRPGSGSFVTSLNATSTTKSNKSKRLGFILDQPSDDYNSVVCAAAQKYAKQMGYELYIQISLGDQDRERDCLESLRAIGVSGYIIIPTMTRYYSLELMQTVIDGYKIVSINRDLGGIPASLVSTDHIAAVSSLVDHLYTSGRHNLAYIDSAYQSSSGMKARMDGFISGMRARGHANPLVCSISSQEGEWSELWNFFSDHTEIDGIISHNSQFAFSLKRILSGLGRNTPEDVAIACLDDPLRSYPGHEFTFIQQPGDLVAKKAIELIIKQIENGSSAIERIYLPSEIVKAKIPPKK